MARTITIDLDDTAVMESLAAVQHDIWAHWMRYQFSCCTAVGGLICGLPSGDMTIPADKVVRWVRQMNTAYNDLSEKERESDREQAVKILAALTQR